MTDPNPTEPLNLAVIEGRKGGNEMTEEERKQKEDRLTKVCRWFAINYLFSSVPGYRMNGEEWYWQKRHQTEIKTLVDELGIVDPEDCEDDPQVLANDALIQAMAYSFFLKCFYSGGFAEEYFNKLSELMKAMGYGKE